jgi:hypothetical protein
LGEYLSGLHFGPSLRSHFTKLLAQR